MGRTRGRVAETRRRAIYARTLSENGSTMKLRGCRKSRRVTGGLSLPVRCSRDSVSPETRGFTHEDTKSSIRMKLTSAARAVWQPSRRAFRDHLVWHWTIRTDPILARSKSRLVGSVRSTSRAKGTSFNACVVSHSSLWIAAAQACGRQPLAERRELCLRPDEGCSPAGAGDGWAKRGRP